jgi:hypothetical protein
MKNVNSTKMASEFISIAMAREEKHGEPLCVCLRQRKRKLCGEILFI